MRTGAIFARGSCRALKWMALFGLVVALGAGSAVAQTTGITITGPSNNTVNEGGTATYTVGIRGYIGVAADSDTPTNPAEFTVSLTLPDEDALVAGATEGELDDLNANAHVLSVSFDPPANSSTINRRLYTASKTISVATLHDNDAEDEFFPLTFPAPTNVPPATPPDPKIADIYVAQAGDNTDAVISLPSTPAALTIDDDETQTYTLTLAPSQTPTEGSPFVVNLAASPAHEDGSGTMQVNIDKRSGWTLTVGDTDSANPAIVTGSGADATVELGITQTAGDGNRVTDTVTVSAHTGVAGSSVEEASLSIDVADANALQAVTAKVVDADGMALDPQPTSVEEGESVKIAVMPVDKDDKVTTANEALKIALASSGSADARDFRLSAPIEITSGQNKSNVVDLIVESDEDVGMEMLVLDATVSGEPANGTETKPVAGVLTLDITDATDKKIQPKSEEDAYPLITDPMAAAAGDDGLNPGESFMVPMDDLFTLMAGYTATYGATSDGSAVSISERGDVVTITAEEEGTSNVTITGTASMAASSFAPSQTVSNVAHVAFEVTVADKMLMVTSLTAEPMEIDEGGMSTITATLNRAVTSGDGEVMIGLSVVGDGTLDMESIAIAMGEMSGSAMLTAAEDDDYMDTEVTVVATGSGIDGTMQVTVMVTDNDEAPTTVMAKADAQSVFDDNVGSDFIKGGDAVSFDAGNLFEQFGADVDPVFAVTSSDDMVVGAAISGSMLTLTPAGYGSATVSVTVTDRATGDTATASGDVMVGLADVSVMVTAADMMIDEGGSTMVTATTSRMLEGDEMVTVNLAVVGDATLSADSIEIAAGSDSGSVTLMSTDDDVHEQGEMVTVIASGDGIDGNMSIEIAVTDNDDAPVVEPTVTAKDDAAQMILDAVATAAGGADWMVGGMVATVDMADLFTADEGASISYAGMSSSEAVMVGTSGTMLMLTPMAEGVSSITVTASDSTSMDVARVDADVAVALQTLSIGVAASADTVTEGGSVTLTATANRAVTVETMLTVTVTGDTDAVSADAMITIAMGQTTGTGMVMALEDDDSADAMVSVVVSGTVLASPVTFDIAITDNDPTVTAKSDAEVDAVFTVAVATASGTDGWVPTSQGGEAATLDMGDLFDTNGSPTLEYMAESSAADMVAASTSGAMLTLTPMAMGDATITVTASDSGGDMYDTAMVSSSVMVGQAALEVTVSPETASIAEGGDSVEISAMLNRPAAANVEVMLIRDATSSAGEDDYSLAPSAMVTVMAGDTTGMATLTATDDVMVEGDESLTLVARVKDMGDVGTVTVSIMDNDVVSAFTLSGPMDTNLVEREEYELTVTADPAVQVATEVTIMRDRGESDADDADFTVGSVMLSAGDATGTTMLVVTDDGMDDSGHGMPEVLVLYGMANGESTNSLTFNIWDAAVPALPVIAQLLLAAFLALGGYRRYRRR